MSDKVIIHGDNLWFRLPKEIQNELITSSDVSQIIIEEEDRPSTKRIFYFYK